MLNCILFSENFCLYKTISDDSKFEDQMGLSNFNLTLFAYYKANKNKKDYFNELFVSKITYSEFLISALLFLIDEKVSQNKVPNLHFIAASIALLFFDSDKIAKNIFDILMYLELFIYFPQDAIGGVYEFF